MNVVYVAGDVVLVLMYVTGLVAGILLRRRDGRAAVLIAIGFGVAILTLVLGIANVFIVTSLPAAVPPETFVGASSTLTRLLTLASFVLIFLGVLRLVRRRRTTAGAGVTR